MCIRDSHNETYFYKYCKNQFHFTSKVVDQLWHSVIVGNNIHSELQCSRLNTYSTILAQLLRQSNLVLRCDIYIIIIYFFRIYKRQSSLLQYFLHAVSCWTCNVANLLSSSILHCQETHRKLE